MRIKIWEYIYLCADTDKATVPPAGSDMGAAAHRGHLHKETASHHSCKCKENFCRLLTRKDNESGCCIKGTSSCTWTPRWDVYGHAANCTLGQRADNLLRQRLISVLFLVPVQLFLSGLLNLQDSGLLTEAEPAKLFSNIQEIVRLHTSLWNEVMLRVLKNARQARTLLDPTDLHHGFRTVSWNHRADTQTNSTESVLCPLKQILELMSHFTSLKLFRRSPQWCQHRLYSSCNRWEKPIQWISQYLKWSNFIFYFLIILGHKNSTFCPLDE